MPYRMSVSSDRSGRLQPFRIAHLAVGRDDYGVGIRQRVDELQSLCGPQDENRLGKAVGARGIGGNDGDAAHRVRRLASARVDDVVIPHSTLVEEAFVVA